MATHGSALSRRFFLAAVLCAVLAPVTSPQVVRQMTRLSSEQFGEFALDDSGATVVASLGHDPIGTNNQHAPQVFSWSLPTVLLSQKTSLLEGIADSVSISDDGSTIAFVSPADPVGANHDGSLELFLMDSTTQVITQLTNDPGPNAASVLRVRLSGGGTRAVFLSNADPLGTNPGHEQHLFAIDADGTNLVHLTVGLPVAEYGGFSISDNGAVVAYKSTEPIPLPPSIYESISVIGSNGANRLELTNGGVSGPVISGNGSLVVYERLGQIESIPRAGGVPTVLAFGSRPTVTDDAAWVYFSKRDSFPSSFHEIFEVQTATLFETQITDIPGVSSTHPVVSGDRTRIAFVASFGVIPGATNPDAGSELAVVDIDGSNLTQLTSNAPSLRDYEPAVTPDGTWVVFTSDGDYLGTSPNQSPRIMLFNVDTDSITEITGVISSNPTISQDGSLISFLSRQDPFGANPSNASQVFTSDSSGGSLQQITTGSAEKYQPILSNDGAFIIFQTAEDYAGSNPDGNLELFRVLLSDGSFTQLTTDSQPGGLSNTRIADNGQWIVFHSQTDFDGANPNGFTQVFRARTDGTVEQRITTDAGASAFSPTVSSDGNRVVFTSNSDPFGTNSDANLEIFLWDAAGPSLQQLTFTAGPDDRGIRPTITPDGLHVFFFSTHPFFEDRPDRPKELYRLRVADLTVERASGLYDPRTEFGSSDTGDEHPVIDVDSLGRAIVLARANLAGENRDLDQQLWRIAFDEPQRVSPSKAAPTVVRWDPTPQALRYDVIRGDVADLSTGAGAVDLGQVVCLEDDSPDNTTQGFEDPTEPTPGQAFFYLLRESQGVLAAPGTWGTGAGGERLPSGGDCPS